MSWDEALTLGSLTLADVAKAAWLEDEGGGAWIDSTYRVPNLDGRAHDPGGPLGPMDLELRVVLRRTGPGGAITHPNGEYGHVVENLSKIKKELRSPSLVALGRTDPHRGQIRAMVKQIAPALRRGDSQAYGFLLNCPSGSWQDAAESVAGPGVSPAVTTRGDTRIHDPIIVFSAAGTFTHTDSAGVESEIVAAAGPTYPVTVQQIDGKWRVTDNTGADARDAVTPSQPWWIRFEPDLLQTIVTDVSVTVRWRNRWA